MLDFDDLRYYSHKEKIEMVQSILRFLGNSKTEIDHSAFKKMLALDLDLQIEDVESAKHLPDFGLDAKREWSDGIKLYYIVCFLFLTDNSPTLRPKRAAVFKYAKSLDIKYLQEIPPSLEYQNERWESLVKGEGVQIVNGNTSAKAAPIRSKDDDVPGSAYFRRDPEPKPVAKEVKAKQGMGVFETILMSGFLALVTTGIFLALGFSPTIFVFAWIAIAVGFFATNSSQ